MTDVTHNVNLDIYPCTITAPLGNGGTLTIMANLPADARGMNTALDRIQKAVERQQAKGALMNAEAHLVTLARKHRYLLDDIRRIDEKGGGDPANPLRNLSGPDRQAREACTIQATRLMEDIEDHKRNVTELKYAAGMQ